MDEFRSQVALVKQLHADRKLSRNQHEPKLYARRVYKQAQEPSLYRRKAEHQANQLLLFAHLKQEY